MSPFLTENSLKIKSHTGEGADRCKPCAKVFSCQKNLKVHLVTICIIVLVALILAFVHCVLSNVWSN